MFTPDEFPKIISVDDHVMEPPTVWSDRLPEKFRELGPTMHRRKVAEMTFVGGVFSYRESGPDEDGTWCDWWDTEDLRYPLTRVMAAAGVPREEITVSPITMEDMRPGCWDPKARLEDMDVNWVEDRRQSEKRGDLAEAHRVRTTRRVAPHFRRRKIRVPELDDR